MAGRRVLVVGACGTIGRALTARLRQLDWAVLTTSRRPGVADMQLDLSAAPDDWPDLPDVDVAVIVAAVAVMSECRNNPAASARVNVEGTCALARRLAAKGAHAIHLSSNHVGSGTHPHLLADAAPCPRTEYGRQKAVAETVVLGCGGTVLRLTKVLTADTGVVSEWATKLRSGEVVAPFHDFSLAPVSLGQAVDACVRLSADPAPGVFQLSGDEDVSYAEAARLLAHAIGSDPALVRPISLRDRNLPIEDFPPFSSMDVGDLQSRYGVVPPRSRAVLAEVFADVAHTQELRP